ncbi:ATP-binding protein [Deinococcus humi]|uniref:histidine kinase n=1 Tax=Deinococcus humi TaxID=662880 RepID=A0A7W8JTF1_9DEIO|nr:ATP-binding protein [Deinococcus humi]MBB5362900.1 hypothetical protein [Deinococcus humi]GGO25766.1 hypothetical protein GCM10008949_15820 [Deinococcus humi]
MFLRRNICVSGGPWRRGGALRQTATLIGVSAAQDGAFVCFSASDNGIGLSITRKIAQRHGGEVWLESIPGEGTTFLVTLHGRLRQGEPATTASGPACRVKSLLSLALHLPGHAAKPIAMAAEI